MILCTLAEAMIHLQVEDEAKEAEIYRKLQAASARVVQYCNATDTDEWGEFTTPVEAVEATLVLLRYYYDESRSGLESDVLPGTVRNLLSHHHDPVAA